MNLKPESSDTRPKSLLPAEREVALQRYINALEQGDDDTIEAVLQLALSDVTLCERISEANVAMAEEIAPQLTPEIAPHAQIVEDLARQHIPMGFETPQPRVLTFGDVAQELAKRREIPSADYQLSTQLSRDSTPLPQRLSLPELRKIGRALGQKLGLPHVASDRFWREFHGTAVRLVKRHANRGQTVKGWGTLAAGLAREENSRQPPKRSTLPTEVENDHQH